MANILLNTVPRQSDGTPLPVTDNGDGTAEVRLPAGLGGPSAPVERLVTQTAGVPSTITIVGNETVVLTPDGTNPITIDWVLPASGEVTIGSVEITGSGSQVVWHANIDAGDWPEATVPDVSTGRHRIDGERGASGRYALARTPYQ